ncbi:MAG: hypothetical protein IKP97_00515 [Kiritimatiellae bacterium]|nr:hypothetical protein [Kiritimatiellia bacterium]
MNRVLKFLAVPPVAAIGVLTPHISRAATVRTATEPWVTNKVAQAAADVLADAEDYVDASLTNYYTKTETDVAIAAATPADYNTVKEQVSTNADDIAALKTGKQDAIADLSDIRAGAALGATAMQSYTESDPSVPAWAKADNKPTYAYSEITGTPTTWAWSALTGLPTTLAGYGITDALSRTSTTMTSPGVYTEYLIDNSLQGGVRMRYGSTSAANHTTYMYSGVAARRNGITTDYLWDTTSESGIVRRSELATALAAKYEKPSGGIPKTDLAAGVQASLNKADTALQSAPVTSVNNKTGAVTLTASDVGALGNTGNQNLNGNLSFWNRQLIFEFWDAMLTPVMTVMGYNIFLPTGKTGTLALLSDIPSVAGLAPLASPAFTGTPTAPDIGTNTTSQVATKKYVDDAVASAAGGGVEAVSVADGGTFGTGDLADGKVEMWRVTCAGAYTPSSAWHLIGYGVWPAAGSTWQCTVWRIGSAYYCNIIVVE